jgi:hypothetical protein
MSCCATQRSVGLWLHGWLCAAIFAFGIVVATSGLNSLEWEAVNVGMLAFGAIITMLNTVDVHRHHKWAGRLWVLMVAIPLMMALAFAFGQNHSPALKITFLCWSHVVAIGVTFHSIGIAVHYESRRPVKVVTIEPPRCRVQKMLSVFLGCGAAFLFVGGAAIMVFGCSLQDPHGGRRHFRDPHLECDPTANEYVRVGLVSLVFAGVICCVTWACVGLRCSCRPSHQLPLANDNSDLTAAAEGDEAEGDEEEEEAKEPKDPVLETTLQSIRVAATEHPEDALPEPQNPAPSATLVALSVQHQSMLRLYPRDYAAIHSVLSCWIVAIASTVFVLTGSTMYLNGYAALHPIVVAGFATTWNFAGFWCTWVLMSVYSEERNGQCFRTRISP